MLELRAIDEKLDQYKNENSMWLRSLEFLKQENNHLKDRLTVVVDKTSDRSFLAQAEHFPQVLP
jgi:cell shape-determining protein MreC